MRDSTPTPGTSDAATPDPVFFDPSFDRVPAGAAWDAARPGPVLLLFDPAAGREWVADAAISLATGWAREDRRVVLADLSLDDPVLHERIGMPNQDGIVDVFLYGASLARSARPVPGRNFYLISSGTYTPDAADVLRHPRWTKIVAGFRDAEASLLLLAPIDAEGLDALVARADGAIYLGGEGGMDRALAALGDGPRPRAWLAPPPDGGVAKPAAPRPEGAGPFAEPEPAAAAMAPLPREGASVAGVGDDDAAATAAERQAQREMEIPPEDEPEPETKPAGRNARLLVLLLLLLVVAGVFALVTLFPEVLGMEGGEASSAASAAAPAAGAPVPLLEAEAAGTALPYAVHVRAYDSPGAARRFAREAGDRLPGVPFYVVPEERDGVVYHKVVAGMLADTAQALDLRERLLDEEIAGEDDVEEAYDLIVPRPYAFVLGEYASEARARGVADSLASAGVPAYAAALPLADGRERWRVWGGAFRDSARAAAMEELLTAAGVPARLQLRSGRPPAEPK